MLMMNCKVTYGVLIKVSYSVISLNQTLYLSGVWLDVDQRTDTKQTCGQKRLDYVLKKCWPR